MFNPVILCDSDWKFKPFDEFVDFL